MAMTMQERITHAEDAIRAYRISKSENAEAPFDETDASDLIADLLHFQVHLGFDVELAVECARMHFDGEQEEEGVNPPGRYSHDLRKHQLPCGDEMPEVRKP